MAKRERDCVEVESSKKQCNILDDLIGLCDDPEIESEPAPATVENNSDIEQFFFQTNTTKFIHDILHIFKDAEAKLTKQIVCNLMFSLEGMFIFITKPDLTIIQHIHFGTDLFSTLRCTNAIEISINLTMLSKSLSQLLKIKSTKVSFTNNSSGFLVMSGDSGSESKGEIRLSQFSALQPHILAPEGLRYNVSIQLHTAELASRIMAMPSEFHIQIDHDRNRLVFYGKGIEYSTSLYMDVPKNVIELFRADPELSHYDEIFRRADLLFITKITNCSRICIGLKSKGPIFIQLKFSDHDTYNDHKATYADVYITSKIGDDDDDDDYDDQNGE